MSENVYSEQIDTRLYNSESILIATFFGGPLVGGYMVAENFKHMGEPEKAKQTWILAILGLSVLLTLIGFIQGSKVPWYILPIGYTTLTYLPMKWLQGAKIKAHLQTGGDMHKSDRILVICFVGMVATYVALLIATTLMQVVAAGAGDAA